MSYVNKYGCECGCYDASALEEGGFCCASCGAQLKEEDVERYVPFNERSDEE